MKSKFLAQEKKKLKSKFLAGEKEKKMKSDQQQQNSIRTKEKIL